MPKTKGPNKSAFIRTMPNAHPNEIVKAAAGQGIKLTPSFVYAIRAMDKQKNRSVRSLARKVAKPGTKPVAKAATGKARANSSVQTASPRTKAAAHGGNDLRHQFVAIAMRIGTDEAQLLLDRIVDVQTPLSALKR